MSKKNIKRSESETNRIRNILLIILPLFISVLNIMNCNAGNFYGDKTKKTQTTKLIEAFLSFNYTTHIYFDSNVNYVDIGYSDEIIWKFTDNMVKLTLKSNHFSVKFTNMTVHTTQAIYGFILKIDEKQTMSPYYFISANQALKIKKNKVSTVDNENHVLTKNISKKKIAVVRSENVRDRIHADKVNINTNGLDFPTKNITEVMGGAYTDGDYKKHTLKQTMIERALKERSAYYNIGTMQDGIVSYLSNIYIIKDSIYMKITYKNRSTIDFNLSYISFTIEKKKKKRNSVLEEVQILPTAIYPSNIEIIKSKSKKVSLLYCLGSFIPTRKQTVTVYIGEEKGRIITFTVPNEYFLKAKKIE